MNAMTGIFKFEFRQTLKKPLIWIGIIIVTLYMCYEFRLYYTDNFPLVTEKEYDKQISKLEKREETYALEMLIPKSEEEHFITIVEKYSNFLYVNYGLDIAETAEYIINNQLSIEEINQYVKAKIGNTHKPVILLDKKNIGQFTGNLRVGSYNEYTTYLNDILAKENYTEHMGKKVADIGGIVFMFYCFVVFTMVFDTDSKSNMYELLHSKKMKSSRYVISKYLGFGAAVIFTGFLAFTLVNVITCLHCYKLNLDFNIFSFYKYYFAWVVMSVLFVEAVIIAMNLIVKSGIPAIPVLVMYLLAGTTSTTDSNGLRIISQTFWNIMIRLSSNSERLLQILPQSFYREALINKLFQGALTVILILLSIHFYDRKIAKNRN